MTPSRLAQESDAAAIEAYLRLGGEVLRRTETATPLKRLGLKERRTTLSLLGLGLHVTGPWSKHAGENTLAWDMLLGLLATLGDFTSLTQLLARARANTRGSKADGSSRR